jgi:hypothetical protein
LVKIVAIVNEKWWNMSDHQKEEEAAKMMKLLMI